MEWYLAVVILTLICNFDESFLFEPKHLGSMLFVIACVGLKQEWLRLRASAAPQSRGSLLESLVRLPFEKGPFMSAESIPQSMRDAAWRWPARCL